MLRLVLVLWLAASTANAAGILFPRPSETREVIPLDGLWDFAVANSSSEIKKWQRVNLRELTDLDIQLMPVPASYNDVVTDADIRGHVGLVWYERKFFVPRSWAGQRVWVRFSSVGRAAEVYINEQFAVSHEIGHLPFLADITESVIVGRENTITVVVDNRLLPTTIPQGVLETLPNGRVKQTFTWDFFNYAGIDRPVVLYTTPNTYIDDITVTTEVDGENAFVNYSVAVEGDDNLIPRVSLADASGTEVVTDSVLAGQLFVQNANLWWPYLMDPNPGYQYSFIVQLQDNDGNVVDKYVLPVGLRTITWDNKSVQINGKPIYLRGLNRHEDSDFRGKGLDLPLVIRDYNLIRWLGANAYRTSHYPYAEEIMDMADKFGIMILDESPAINTENFTSELLDNHKQALSELIQRDKNRAGVIIWSAANEPRTQTEGAEDYYREIVAHIKSLDTSRPVTVINNQLPDNETSGQFIDIAACNVYLGWYNNVGDWDVLLDKILAVPRQWNEMHDIPVMMTEFGADTLEGFHSLPAVEWSEEYQRRFISAYHEAFDILREEGYFIGELAWNFADFQTDQRIHRKKGIFTRNRQPKAAAHLVRKRYWTLAQELDQSDVPDDLNTYVINKSTRIDEV